MNSIRIPVSSLLSKAVNMSNENMVDVQLTLVDEAVDQGAMFPSFLYFEGFTKDGMICDYESIDASSPSSPKSENDTNPRSDEKPKETMTEKKRRLG